MDEEERRQPALSVNNVSPERACVGSTERGFSRRGTERHWEKRTGLKTRPYKGMARRGENGVRRRVSWGGPGGAGGGAVDPVDCLGAGIGEFVGMIAEAFADGVPPDVAGDVLYLIGGPKNVVVVTRFPESAAMGLAKLEGRALFEEADEFEQVAAVVCTLDKNMKVIGHQTVGVKTVGMAGGAFRSEEHTSE